MKTWGKLEPPREGESCINFLVDDLVKAHEKLKEKGVEVIKEPKDTLWGARMILVKDPDNNTLQFSKVDWKEYFRICSS